MDISRDQIIESEKIPLNLACVALHHRIESWTAKVGIAPRRERVEKLIEPPCRAFVARFLVASTSLTSLVSCSPKPSYTHPVHLSAIELNPARLDLGKVRPGGMCSGKVLVSNRGTETILAAQFETSCPCVRATLDREKIGPGEIGTLTVNFNSSEEPDFRGCLSVEYIGRSSAGDALLTGLVDVVVEVGPSSVAITEHIRGEQPQEP